MGNVLKQPVIERHIVTKQGELEITINLNLTITLDSDGALKLAVAGSPSKKNPEDKVSREIPSLGPCDLIEFGKEV